LDQGVAVPGVRLTAGRPSVHSLRVDAETRREIHGVDPGAA
jgi:hypothetical protein